MKPLPADKVILFLLPILPFSVWGPSLFYGQAYILLILGAAVSFLYVPSYPLRWFGIYLAGWLGFQWSASFLGLMPEEMISLSIQSVAFYLCGVGVFIAITKSRVSDDIIMDAVCTLVIGQILLATIQKCFFGWEDCVGFLGNRNFMGALLAITFPFFLRRRWVAFFIPAILWGLYFAHTTTAWVCIAVSMGYFVFRWWGVGSVIVALSVMAYLFPAHLGSLYERIGFWADAASKINSIPLILFGVGPGVDWAFRNELHNEWARMWWNFGLIGVGFMVWFLGSLRGSRVMVASLIAIVVNTMANHPFHVPVTAVTCVIIFAMMRRYTYASESQEG